MLDCVQRMKCDGGLRSVWNRKRRFPLGGSGQELPFLGGLAAWGMSAWQREGGGARQQHDPKPKQSPERGRNSQVGENMLVRFLSCL